MNEFLKMDIFFVIAAVAMVILTVLLVIISVYLIKFVKNIKYISDQARVGTDNLKHALSFFGSIIKRRKKDK